MGKDTPQSRTAKRLTAAQRQETAERFAFTDWDAYQEWRAVTPVHEVRRWEDYMGELSDRCAADNVARRQEAPRQGRSAA